MTSQGQRFRRRALRRGYKVDEVDAFLDRVEATLAGDPIGAPVAAQEVHDVVFRVRFGGYDEWQVDLHLDRVERQLAELEERGGYAPRPDARPMPVDRGPVPERAPMGPPDRPGGPDRIGPPERMGPPDRMGPPERMGPPPERMMPPAAASMPGRPGMPPPGPPPRDAGRDPGYGRYDEPTYSGVEDPYGPGRRGRADMTAELRMNEPTFGGGSTGSMGPPPGASRPASVPPSMGPVSGPPTSVLGAVSGPPAGTPLSGEAHRLDQLRRTFQLRRFGSGYHRAQVDQLFEGLILGLSGRGPLPGSDAELAPSRFELVPGGYFEAEVDAALKEARDILSRRR